jgi:neurotransmitter:Na+ symporter, NSS family
VAQGPAWQSRTTFVLALSAAAVGLGSLWRFAWLMGTHGGGAFMLTYVACLFLIAVPVLVAEVLLGSYGRANPSTAIQRVADRSLLSRQWHWIGVLACITGLLILSYQVVVAGWSFSYARMLQADRLSAASAQIVGDSFAAVINNPWEQIKWQTVFLGVVVSLVAVGVRRGLGILVWLAVPVLITLLGVLVQFALEYGDLEAAQDFLFTIKMVDFNRESILAALGHALLTLGAGAGVGIAYGAYSPRRIPIGRSVMAVAVFDTIVALMAAIAIFPVVFANNMDPAGGPGLMFLAAPYAFGNLMQGELFGSLFFLLMVVAAAGTTAALMEPSISLLVGRFGIRRYMAATYVGTAVWFGGWAVAVSFQPQGWFGMRNLMAVLDQLTASLLLPLVSLLTVILVAWRLRPEVLRPQLARESDTSFFIWRTLLRYIAPPALAVILLADVLR